MATQDEVELILENLQEVHPAEFFKTLNEENAGIGAVLRYLNEAEGDVTAGNISKYLHVSTARVAVLLKKMAAQGLVTKEDDAYDARITIVHISPKGEEKIRQIHDEIYAEVSKVIDKVGIERMMDFILISNEIRSAFLHGI